MRVFLNQKVSLVNTFFSQRVHGVQERHPNKSRQSVRDSLPGSIKTQSQFLSGTKTNLTEVYLEIHFLSDLVNPKLFYNNYAIVKFVMTSLHHHEGHHCMLDASQTQRLDDNPSLHKTKVLVILCLPFYALLSCTEQKIGSVTRVRSVVCRADSGGRVLSASQCNPYKPFVGLFD